MELSNRFDTGGQSIHGHASTAPWHTTAGGTDGRHARRRKTRGSLSEQRLARHQRHRIRVAGHAREGRAGDARTQLRPQRARPPLLPRQDRHRRRHRPDDPPSVLRDAHVAAAARVLGTRPADDAVLDRRLRRRRGAVRRHAAPPFARRARRRRAYDARPRLLAHDRPPRRRLRPQPRRRHRPGELRPCARRRAHRRPADAHRCARRRHRRRPARAVHRPRRRAVDVSDGTLHADARGTA